MNVKPASVPVMMMCSWGSWTLSSTIVNVIWDEVAPEFWPAGMVIDVGSAGLVV